MFSAYWCLSNRSWRSRSFDCCITMGRCLQYTPGIHHSLAACFSSIVVYIRWCEETHITFMASGEDIRGNYTPWKSSEHGRAWWSQEQSSLLRRIGALLKVKKKEKKTYSSRQNSLFISFVCTQCYFQRRKERGSSKVLEKSGGLWSIVPRIIERMRGRGW